MISQSFYVKTNLVKQFLDAKVKHYPVKEPSVTWSWYDYRIKAGEDLYTIAARIFGDGLEYMWTYIADNNMPRMPDDWNAGDIIRLPKIIIRDTDNLSVTYSDV